MATPHLKPITEKLSPYYVFKDTNMVQKFEQLGHNDNGMYKVEIVGLVRWIDVKAVLRAAYYNKKAVSTKWLIEIEQTCLFNFSLRKGTFENLI